jgi:hypothetical protein
MGRVVVATVALLAAVVTPARAQDAVGTLSGRVVSAGDVAVPGAVASLRAADGSSTRTSTDADGRFTFARLAAGAYELTVTAPRLSTSVQTITIGPDGDAARRHAGARQRGRRSDRRG